MYSKQTHSVIHSGAKQRAFDGTLWTGSNELYGLRGTRGLGQEEKPSDLSQAATGLMNAALYGAIVALAFGLVTRLVPIQTQVKRKGGTTVPPRR